MQSLDNKKNFDINKIGKNLLEEYIHIYKIDKNNNETQKQKETLLIYTLTYNIHGTMPSEKEISFLFPKKNKFEKFDVFVINTQECLRSIPASFFVSTKEPWIQTLSNFFGNNYINIINSNLGALHISIFIKKEKAIYFHDLRNGEIKTGFLNIMANKGAVSASMKYYDKNILFICCHLTAGQDKNIERNANLERIRNYLQNSVNKESRNKLRSFKKSIINNLKAPSKTLILNDNNNRNKKENIKSSLTINLKNKNEQHEEEERIISRYEEDDKETNKFNNQQNYNKIEICKKLDENNASFLSIENSINSIEDTDKFMNEYDIVIMSGDLNYRLDPKNMEINESMKKNDPEILWAIDQLTEEIKEKYKLKEGIKKFMPTYKFKEFSNEYDYSRIPGWTDRILYKSKNLYDIMLCEYSSITDINISDHKPVYAVFKINCKDKKYSNNNYLKNRQECNIM